MTNIDFLHMKNYHFKVTNTICVIQSTSQTGSKNNFPFPVDYPSYFYHTKVPWGPPDEA